MSVATIRDFAPRWLRELPHTHAPNTARLYEGILRREVLTHAIADRAFDELDRFVVREWLLELRERGMKRRYNQRCLYLFASLCNAAVDKGLLRESPTPGAGKGLFRRMTDTTERSMTGPQLNRFLQAAEHEAPAHFDYFLTLARCGLRPGEGLALRRDAVHLEQSRIRVAHNWVGGTIGLGETKTRIVRWVDVNEELHERLSLRLAERSAVPWLFPSTETGLPYHRATPLHAMRRVLEVADLPARFSLHTFRHTYVRVLRELGVPMDYIQSQLGHASIAMTLDYGRDADLSNRSYVNRFERMRRPSTRSRGPSWRHPTRG